MTRCKTILTIMHDAHSIYLQCVWRKTVQKNMHISRICMQETVSLKSWKTWVPWSKTMWSLWKKYSTIMGLLSLKPRFVVFPSIKLTSSLYIYIYHMTMLVSDVIYPLHISLFTTYVILQDRILGKWRHFSGLTSYVSHFGGHTRKFHLGSLNKKNLELI